MSGQKLVRFGIPIDIQVPAYAANVQVRFGGVPVTTLCGFVGLISTAATAVTACVGVCLTLTALDKDVTGKTLYGLVKANTVATFRAVKLSIAGSDEQPSLGFQTLSRTSLSNIAHTLSTHWSAFLDSYDECPNLERQVAEKAFWEFTLGMLAVADLEVDRDDIENLWATLRQNQIAIPLLIAWATRRARFLDPATVAMHFDFWLGNVLDLIFEDTDQADAFSGLACLSVDDTGNGCYEDEAEEGEVCWEEFGEDELAMMKASLFA